MALNYMKKDGDKRYRQVSLINEVVGPWTEFDEARVEYPEQCVLEVEHADGSCTQEYERGAAIVNVGRDGSQLFLAKTVPLARVWVQGSDSMMYKVPAGLPERDGKVYLLIPGGTHSVSLCGDKYFNKAYKLSIS